MLLEQSVPLNMLATVFINVLANALANGSAVGAADGAVVPEWQSARVVWIAIFLIANLIG